MTTGLSGRLKARCTWRRARAWIATLARLFQRPRAPASMLMHVALATTCHISTPGVTFGNYDVFNTLTTDGAGTISVNCDATTSYTITLSAGNGSMAMRIMTNGNNQLGYNLYSTPTRTTVWGDGTAGSVTVSGLTATTAQTVYGRIPALQNLPVGNYSDNLMMTLTF